jgi:hypothetical protein
VNDARSLDATSVIVETTRPGQRKRKSANRLDYTQLLRSFQNMKIGTIQALACVGLGTLIGFIAANKDFSRKSRAEGAPR